MLEDDAPAHFTDRARIARYSDVRWERHDKPLGTTVRNVTDSHDAPELVVVEHHGDDVRVVSERDKLRLLAWVEKGDLLSVVTRPSWLAEGPKAPPPTKNGVRVLPGLAPELGQHTAGRVRVSYDDGRASFDGWLASDRIGRIYKAGEPRKRDATHVVSRTPVLAAPGGAKVAELGGEIEYEGVEPVASVKLLGKPQGMSQRIEYEAGYYRIFGFVPTTRLVRFDRKAYQAKQAGSSEFSVSDAVQVRLPPRTCLFARAGGQPIGVTLDSYETYASAGNSDGFRRVVLNTPWGLIDARAREEASGDAGSSTWQRCAE